MADSWPWWRITGPQRDVERPTSSVGRLCSIGCCPFTCPWAIARWLPDRGSLLGTARGALPTEGYGRGAWMGWVIVIASARAACSCVSWVRCCGASRASSSTREASYVLLLVALCIGKSLGPRVGGTRYVSGHPGTVTRRRFATYSLLLTPYSSLRSVVAAALGGPALEHVRSGSHLPQSLPNCYPLRHAICSQTWPPRPA